MSARSPRIRRARRTDPTSVALREIDMAIDLVRTGRARVVELAGLDAAERAAGLGIAQAQAAQVGFSLRRSPTQPGAVTLRIGPSLDDAEAAGG
jgi:hypothetical protein